MGDNFTCKGPVFSAVLGIGDLLDGKGEVRELGLRVGQLTGCMVRWGGVWTDRGSICRIHGRQPSEQASH